MMDGSSESNERLERLNSRDTALQERFGNVVRRWREELELSQETLAERAGIHHLLIGPIEHGKRMPTLEVVHKLARALETTMSSLLAEVESTKL